MRWWRLRFGEVSRKRELSRGVLVMMALEAPGLAMPGRGDGKCRNRNGRAADGFGIWPLAGDTEQATG
ncbi:MAG: hypothetical protein D6725_02225 [Planctomycetota bacterium]|nr:MAG: hypothetical protein D6725_02225 [Planctomycetota bacterium]